VPIYQYRCDDCGCEQEVFYKLAEKPKMLACNVCTGTCFQVPALGHGGIQSDEPSWLPGACASVQPPEARRIGTRSEFKRYLKEKGYEAL